jgi:hypothetical protein
MRSCVRKVAERSRRSEVAGVHDGGANGPVIGMKLWVPLLMMRRVA